MYNPYKTTYGRILNASKLSEELVRYLTTADIDNLGYEYDNRMDVKVAFITGYNEEERELPVIGHPIIVVARGITVIVSDLRQFVKKSDEQPLDIADIVKDTNSSDFIVIRTLLTRDFVAKGASDFGLISKPMSTAFGIWITSLVDTMVGLDPVESLKVETVSSLYANSLFFRDIPDVKDNLDTIINRTSTGKQVYKLDKKIITSTLLEVSEMITEYKGMELLIALITEVLPDEKSRFVNVNGFSTLTANVWYGPGGGETSIIALENMSTWMAMVYSGLTNRSYSKTRIGMLLKKYNRVIDSRVMEKFFIGYLKD